VHCADFRRGVSIEGVQKTLGVNLGREIQREINQEKDFGPGIQPRIHENYFRPFFDSAQ
jgi:C4-dicarboxylate-specific signal transduction histidine kinase